MTNFNALYYPSWDPPVDFVRSVLLFFDKVEVIIPSDVSAHYDERNSKVFDLIPDCFGERRDDQYEMGLDDLGWQRFERALDDIVQRTRPSNQVKIVIGQDGIGVEGHVFTRNEKLTEKVLHLLNARQLVRPELTKMIDEPGAEGSQVVEERASCLILSVLADNLSRRFGLRTITDEQLDFSVTTMGHLERKFGTDVESCLASSIIKTEIPRTIGILEPNEFVALRDRFEAVRTPFQRAIRELSKDNLLYKISDEKELVARIQSATNEYHHAVEQFRKTAFASKLKDWGPFGIGCLLSVPGLAPSLSAQLVRYGLQVVVRVFGKTMSKPGDDNEAKSQQMIGGLRNELLDYDLLRRMIVGRPYR